MASDSSDFRRFFKRLKVSATLKTDREKISILVLLRDESARYFEITPKFGIFLQLFVRLITLKQQIGVPGQLSFSRETPWNSRPAPPCRVELHKNQASLLSKHNLRHPWNTIFAFWWSFEIFFQFLDLIQASVKSCYTLDVIFTTFSKNSSNQLIGLFFEAKSVATFAHHFHELSQSFAEFHFSPSL